jgi:hypothetical protein
MMLKRLRENPSPKRKFLILNRNVLPPHTLNRGEKKRLLGIIEGATVSRCGSTVDSIFVEVSAGLGDMYDIRHSPLDQHIQ